MKPGRGRNKGSRFEREVAALIVQAFQHKGIKPEHCYRTPQSGGHRYASKKDPGDLQIAVELRQCGYLFGNECKSYRKLNWAELYKPTPCSGLKFKRNSGKFIDWWKQTCVAVQGTKDKPLLIFKQNNSPAYCMGRLSDLKGFRHLSPLLITTVNGDVVRVMKFAQLLEELAGA